MNSTASPTPKTLSLPVVLTAVVAVAVVIGGIAYLNRPSAPAVAPAQASGEAKAYVHNLQLSDVTMQATDNFMNQRVVEVQGKIANAGARPLRSVDIFCLFMSPEGREIGRERLPIVPPTGIPLKPNETRNFRLPFDSIPEGWNQAMPRMVIADITFAK